MPQIFTRRDLMFVDSHCHLDAPPLCTRLERVLDAARRAEVEKYVVPGVSPDGWDGIARIASEWNGIHPAFGIHPLFAQRCDQSQLGRLRLLSAPAVAIGEIGLDYLIKEIPRDIQRAAFRAQLRLAVEAGRPVIVHCRRAFRDLLAILREEKVQRVGGVMHAFSGSVEIACECVALGMTIGVAGTVTFPNAVRPLEVVRKIPLGNLLLETDAPDLSPEPYRGRDNEPAFLPRIAREVAAIKGVPLTEVAATTTRNAVQLFRLS